MRILGYATIARFQQAVVDWKDSFLTGSIHDPEVRICAFRVLEEAAEVSQAAGLSLADAIRQILYTYERPVGDNLGQEMAQVLVNLVYLADKLGVNLEEEALDELERIDTPEMKAKIFAKQQFKKDHGLR